ncbi:MAG TPA: amino acid ABC transporter substrate-binding protein [Caulobacteraceae bacterium]|jgi:general L-amino acid transport system substrate-binding protein
MIRSAALALVLLGLAACGQDQENASDRRGGPPAPAAVPGAPTAGPAPANAKGGATLQAVKNRGRLLCGVHTGLAGFAYPDNRGVWRGFEVDFCRTLAASIFGDRDAVRFVPLSAQNRFTALQSGEVDILIRVSSQSFSRDANLGLDFVGVNYYDGQGFLVRRGLEVRTAPELSGARICVITGSTTELNLSDFFRSRGLNYESVVVDSVDQSRANYQREACDAVTDDISALASSRSVLDNPQAHVILPDVISKEPLGPWVRQGDDNWADVARWNLYAVLLAEELGVTSRNAEDLRKTSRNPEVRRLLGVEGSFGPMLGLREDWAFQAVRQVGNYGEIFEANLGARSPLKLQRGLNAQWSAQPSGLMYAMPLR